ncbi:hypothetical protein GTZ99_06580 [Novosphingobium sp. FSY-8]|uniref:Tetratricopeptide repeat protein n=1 Tax=Novosphingobium ovatum TaxID=1908523 RepID=A0ABW9XCH1_9SPHN|nr:hypothetical protein [Novosphingobium ovatum]NBC36223.1 hypothetical protein [Novosphingobium ovatum]
MIRTSLQLRGSFLAAALALGVVGGVAGGAVSAQAASGPKFSPAFAAAGGPFQTELDKAIKAPTAEAIAALKPKLDAVIAAASTPDDKFNAGNFAIKLGSLAKDDTITRKGVTLMLESGKASPELAPKLHFYAGQFAAQAKEYDLARKELQLAIDTGFPAADALVTLAEAEFAAKQAPAGLIALTKAIEANKAANTAVPEGWYRRGMGATYETNNYELAVRLATMLVKDYPTKENWALSIAVIRDLGKLPSQDTFDLLRLMAATNSFAEERDYVEFVQTADARRNPAEVKAIIDRGAAAGVVNATKPFFADAMRIATARIAPDKAALPGWERDARAPAATAATVIAAADSFLSYGDAAKAADLYKIALTKAGADKNVVLTRLGIAQINGADYAGAQASLTQVEGVRKAMAQLWIAFAAQKAAGK